MDGPAAVGHLTEAYDQLADPAARAQVAHALSRALLFTGSPAEGAAFAHRAAAELPDELEDDRRGLTAFELTAGYFGVGGAERLRRSTRTGPRRRPARASARRCSRRRPSLWWGYCGEGSADECAELALAALAGGELTAADNGLLSIPGDRHGRAGRPPGGGRRVGATRRSRRTAAGRCTRSPRSTSGTGSRCCCRASSWRRRNRCARGRRSSTSGGSGPSRRSTRAPSAAAR